MESGEQSPEDSGTGRGRLGVRLSLRMAGFVILVGAALFGSAGTFRYCEAWGFLLVYFTASLAISAHFLRTDPGFVERRMKWHEPERRQRVGQFVLAVCYIAGLVIPGLDHRYGWSHVPVWLVLAADAAILGAFAFIFRVFEVNRYAASTVEVEPGQHVVSSGPYAVVRHPMYSGALVMFLASPLALGSYWGMLTALPLVAGLALRIGNEEAVLLRELPGYGDYRRRVRWRLLPGLW